MNSSSSIRLYTDNSDPTRGLLRFQADKSKIHLSEKERTHEIAIRFLNDEEKNDVLKQGRRSGISGWFESFFWKPIKVRDLEGFDHIVLIKVDSAVSRLGVLGFDSEKIRHDLNQEDISAFAKNIEDRFKNDTKIILRNAAKGLKIRKFLRERFFQVLANKINSQELTLEECKEVLKYAVENQKFINTTADFDNIKNEILIKKLGFFIPRDLLDDLLERIKSKLITIEDIKNIYEYDSNQVILTIKEFEEVFNKKLIKEALEKYLKDEEKSHKSRLLNEFIDQKISGIEVEEIFKYRKDFPITEKTTAKELVQKKQQFIASAVDDIINSDDELRKIINRTDRNSGSNIPAKLSTKMYASLPRSIEVNREGKVFVLFNKVKQGDPLLGVGSFNKVKGAIRLPSQGNERLARRKEKKGRPAKSQKEIERHRNLLAKQKNKEGFFPEIYNVTTKGGRTAALVEQFDEDLSHALNPPEGEPKIPMTLEEKLFIAKRSLEIAKFLHEYQFINRDLKPENLLIKRDENGRINRVAIGDMGGICGKLDKNSELGTPFYFSPELARQMRGDPDHAPYYSEKSDNWAIGLTLFQLFREDIPEWERSKFTLPIEKYKTEEGLFKFLSQLKAGWLPESSHPIAKIIATLLHPDPRKRLSTDKALDAFNAVV